MNYKTVEVEIENGQVRASDAEVLPSRARGLLTLFEANLPTVAATCGELAERWRTMDKLPADEASAFANDIEKGRANLPALESAWD